MSPNFKSFKNDKQLLVMYVIVQLCHSKSTGVKGNQINFIFFINNGKSCSESIVQSISLHDELSIRNPMSENRSRDKYFLEGVKLLGNVLSGEMY